MKISEFILTGRDRLAAAGLECADPLLHMKQLVEFGLGLTTSALYLKWDDEIPAEALPRLERMLARRLTGEPFQYIIGEEWFWDYRFSVGPGVLIPRRETEILVEALLRRERRPRVKIAELGPGSGNIGLTCLREWPEWEWHAFESNPETLSYLEANRAAILPEGAPYHIHYGDFFTEAPKHAPYDWIVTNPPYVASEVMQGLSKEVRHEPPLALDGGAEGMDILRHLVDAAAGLLREGGGFISEIGSDQGEKASALFVGKPFSVPEILLDYARLPRVVCARRIGG